MISALQRGANPNYVPSSVEQIGAIGMAALNPENWKYASALPSILAFRPFPPIFSAESPEIIRILVTYGADPNATGGLIDRTPLMNNAFRGRSDLIRTLIAAGADVNRLDKNGCNALLIATENLGYFSTKDQARRAADTVRILIESGIELNIRNAYGSTALMLAKREKQTSIIQLLKDAGATK